MLRIRTFVLFALLALVVAGCGVDPLGTSDAEADTPASGSTLWDESVVHEISVEFDEDDYDDLIATYSDSGEKVWIEATVTIDGSVYEAAGIRLKGNSSLGGLGGGRGPGGDSASADTPEALPWLIDLDKYVDGQNHEGFSELVVRSNNSETALNEAVALDLLEDTGLASEPAIYTSFSVNDGESTLRLVVQHLDDVWMEAQFEEDGVLYKAESTGDYSYRGEDDSAYEEVFDVEAGVDDLGPLKEFLDFVNNSDDAVFLDELDAWLDIDAFVTYLAYEDLIGNFDDIDGPGNNSYLYYDTSAERFTVVAWDHNLAFGGSIGPGGGAFGGDRGLPGGGGDLEPPAGFEPPADGDLEPPAGFEPPADGDFEPPAGFEPPADGDLGDRTGGNGGGFGGPGGRSNTLVERFLAVDEYQTMYDETLAQLESELFDSGRLEEILAARVAVLEASGLVEADTIDGDAEAIRSFAG